MNEKIISVGAALCLAIMSTSAIANDTQSAQVELGDCGDKALQDKLGEPVTGAGAGESVQVGGEPVEASGTIRVVAPGDVVTMEFQPDRLTLETDEDGNLARAQCG